MIVEDNSLVSTNDAMYAWHPYYVDALAVRFREDDRHAFLHDANFNVVAAYDIKSGSGTHRQVVERYQYTPYGEATFLEPDFDPIVGNASAIGNEILYTGRTCDPETTLYDFRTRPYHAGLGRFTTRDWIRYRGGKNLYGYVGGMPTYFVDPAGLDLSIIFEGPPVGWSPPYGSISGPGIGGATTPGEGGVGPCCNGQKYDPETQCCEDGQVVAKVSIWVCKAGLGGDDSYAASICNGIASACAPFHTGYGLELDSLGPISHSYIVCVDPKLNPNTEEKYGFHPHPFDDWHEFWAGPGYVNREVDRDPNDPGTQCKERQICPKLKEDMCKEGLYKDWWYNGCDYGPGGNCHGWVAQ